MKVNLRLVKIFITNDKYNVSYIKILIYITNILFIINKYIQLLNQLFNKRYLII